MKGKILFITLAAFLVMSGMAAAEVSMTTNIETTGDVELETNVQTDGDVEVWIDGTNIGDTLSGMGDAINSQGGYIIQNEGKWSSDKEGISMDDLVRTMHGAIGYLFGERASDSEEQMASDIDAYFASDGDIRYLEKRLSNLELEAEAVSRTLQKIAPEEYCKSKIDMMVEYGFTSVDCGNITYYHWSYHNSPEVTMVIGISPSEGESSRIGTMENLDYIDVPESFMEYIPGETRPMMIDFTPKETIINDNSITLYAFTNAPTSCQYSDEYFAFGEGNDFTSGQGGMVHEVELTPGDDGVYEYYTRCADSYGKVAYNPVQDSGSAKSRITVDTTGPEILCYATEATVTPGTDTEIWCEASDATGIERIEILGLEETIEPGPCVYGYCTLLGIEDLDEGSFILSARATDGAGNENLDSGFAEITVDKTTEAPEPPGPLDVLVTNITGFFTGIQAGINGLF